MVNIIERPHTISFSKNEIRYVLEVSDPATPGCAVDVELYILDITATGAGTRLVAFTVYPTADGLIYCHIASYLEYTLQPQLPLIGGAVIEAIPEQATKYYIKYRQVTTAVPEPDFINDVAMLYTVIYGGIEQIKFRRNNYFANYLPANKNFLTWQPDQRYVAIDQPCYLTFLLTAAATSLKVKVKVVYTDSTFDSQTNTLSLVNNTNILFRITTGATSLGLPLLAPTKTIYYYEVSVTNQADAVLANGYRYYIDYNPIYHFYDLQFFNSLGGLDPVRIKGDVVWSVENNKEDVGHIIFKDTVTIDRPQYQLSHTNLYKRDKYNGDAGFNKSKTEQEALIELLISPGIYEVIDERWIKVLNLKQNLDLRSSADKKWSYPVEWNYGYEERVFTPKKTNLGRGQAYVPVCIAVSLPIALLPDGNVGTAYTYSFVLGGSSPFTLASIVKPSWMTIAVAGNTLSFSGTPDAAATDITVSFRINNCSADHADFSDTINVTLPPVPVPEITQDSNTENGNLRTHIFTIGPNVAVGNRFMVTVYSHNVQVTAVAGDTPYSIAYKLAIAVNATTAGEWNSAGSAPATGTPGFKPTAQSSGNQIMLVLNLQNQFAAGAYVS